MTTPLTPTPPTLADLPLRDGLRGKVPYGAPQLEVKVPINTNENPFPPTEAMIDDLAARLRTEGARLNRYPERDAVELRRALAEYVTGATGMHVTTENVWAANGSNEILQQLLLAFGGPGRRALGFTPSYSMHPLLTEGTMTEFVACPRDPETFEIDVDRALDAIEREQPDVIFITTPNNPTGGITPLEDIARITEHAPGIVIVDEAYAEFSPSPSATTLLPDYADKLVVSRTMSKAFAFAGARVGYFVAAPAFIYAVMLTRLPYHLSVLTQAGAIVALSHKEETLGSVELLSQERIRVIAALEEYGYSVIPSEANFVFFSAGGDSATVWQQFLDHGVLIRDVGVPGYLRASIGTPEDNNLFLEAARAIASARKATSTASAATETSTTRKESIS